MPDIPKLNPESYLAEDVHVPLNELMDSVFVTGIGFPIQRWDRLGRERLARNLIYVVESLRAVGFRGQIAVDGSFAAMRYRCRDIDVCYVMEHDDKANGMAGYLQRLDALNARDGSALWAFDEASLSPAPGVDGLKSPLWHKFRVDLQFDSGLFCGMFGPNGERLAISEAFRICRGSGWPKGMIILRD